ncbi:MAG: hypothetical protein J0L64_04765 [Acidobacteria bacterium]|nr:hypothetical protein [Acidobacteriota bacterium]
MPSRPARGIPVKTLEGVNVLSEFVTGDGLKPASPAIAVFRNRMDTAGYLLTA